MPNEKPKKFPERLSKEEFERIFKIIKENRLEYTKLDKYSKHYYWLIVFSFGLDHFMKKEKISPKLVFDLIQWTMINMDVNQLEEYLNREDTLWKEHFEEDCGDDD